MKKKLLYLVCFCTFGLCAMEAQAVNLKSVSIINVEDYEVVIDGQRDEDAPFIRHFTEVWYARYNYIENGIITPRDL